MQTRSVAAALFAAASVISLAAHAADRPFPHFNVEAICDTAALDPRNKDGYREVYSTCITEEQKAYNTLKSLWSQVENRVVDYCNGAYGEIGAQKNARIEFYEIYLPCVQFLGPGYFQGISDRDQIKREFPFKR